MAANVLDYDPELALFVPDDDSLCFYRFIAAIAKKHLAQDGLLVVEINEALEETPELINQDAFENWIIKVELSDKSDLDNLMDAAAYEAFCK